MRLRPSSWLFAAALVLLFLLVRVPFLTLDPPASLVSFYQDVAFSVFDEGWWTGNARQQAMFGELRGTGFDLFWVSPFFTLVTLGAFHLGGVGVASARAVSLVFGALAVAGLFACGRSGLRDGEAPRRAAVAALLFAFSFAPAQLGRLALPETTGTALGVLGAAALLTLRPAAFLAAGIGAGLASLTKPHFAFLVPTFLAAGFVLSRRHRLPVVPALIVIAGGVALPVLAWGGYVLSHKEEAWSLVSFYLQDRWFAGGAGLGGVLGLVKPLAQVTISGVVYRHALFAALPGVLLLALAAAPRAWRAALRPGAFREVSDATIVFGIWVLVGGVAISSIPFQPLRYYLPLVPALAFLAASFLVPGPRSGTGIVERAGSRSAHLFHAGASWIVGFLAIAQIAFASLSFSLAPVLAEKAGGGRVELLNPEPFQITPFLVSLLKGASFAPFGLLPSEIAYVASLALCGALALGLALGLAVLARGHLVQGVAVSPAIRSVLLAIVLAYQSFLWVRWIPEQAATLPDMGRRIDEIVPVGATVSPAGAYTLASERIYDSRAVRDGRMFDPSGKTDYFVVLEDHRKIGLLPPGEIERRWPGSEHVETFDLTGGYRYGLYRARRLPVPAPQR